MSKKSLADRRSAPAVRPNERSITVCLAPDLIGKMQALTAELDELPKTANTEDAPKRAGVGAESPRAREIREEIAATLEEMADEEGELRVRATVTDGEWRRWCDAHPARIEGEPGYDQDLEVVGGYCNADDLIEALGTYVYAFDGEPLIDGDWDRVFVKNIARPDKKEIATAVVSMYEHRMDFRPWRNALSANLTKLNASVSREASASAPDDSTATSPSESSAATTETATA